MPLMPSFVSKNEKWLSPWDPLFLSAIVNAPGQLVDGYPHHLQQRFKGAALHPSQWHYVEHHLSHAASAFLPSPYENAAVLTIDGRGEKATTTFSMGEGNDIRRISQVNLPNSLGLLYEQVTSHLGFLHSSDEYKVMALASYGKPVFADKLRSMIHLADSGQYVIDHEKLAELIGPARERGEEFGKRHFDIAHSMQAVLQESVLELAAWLKRETGADNLCFAGGVALNCVLNACLRDSGLFKNIWVQPAAGDSGTALGAAMWIDARRTTEPAQRFFMDHAYWGPDYRDEEIEAFLNWTKTPYRKLDDVAAEAAALLAEDKIIGWYQGRMEYGPRALGSRSILASPIHADMQAKLNEVKDREDFRPVAPVVLEEDAADWFDGASYSPFMLFVYKVKEDKKDKIPAVCHVDGTARIQTVNRRQHQRYYDLLQAFKAKTGVPVLINTSFNTLGKPIVCTPRDAVECFWSSPFDALVIGSFLIEKNKR
jgi:carbamoyltransferase